MVAESLGTISFPKENKSEGDDGSCAGTAMKPWPGRRASRSTRGTGGAGASARSYGDKAVPPPTASFLSLSGHKVVAVPLQTAWSIKPLE